MVMKSPTTDINVNEGMRHLSEAKKDFSQAAQSEYAEKKAQIYEVANHAGQRMREFVNTAGTELEHASEVVSTHIRTKPVQSSLIALGAGLFLGMLLRK